jgi:hypothetical protein
VYHGWPGIDTFASETEVAFDASGPALDCRCSQSNHRTIARLRAVSQAYNYVKRELIDKRNTTVVQRIPVHAIVGLIIVPPTAKLLVVTQTRCLPLPGGHTVNVIVSARCSNARRALVHGPRLPRLCPLRNSVVQVGAQWFSLALRPVPTILPHRQLVEEAKSLDALTKFPIENYHFYSDNYDLTRLFPSSCDVQDFDPGARSCGRFVRLHARWDRACTCRLLLERTPPQAVCASR